MKALLLVRVSTLVQDYDQQREELESYAQKLGFNELKIVADKESAIKLSEEERHGINEMKEYLSNNPDCKNVFIWELSRLARTEKVLYSVKEWLVSRKINLIVVSENITLLDKEGNETAAGGLLFSLFGHLASQEMKIKKARMNRGKKAAAEKGKFVGGMFVKLGYKKNDNNFIVVDPEGAKLVRLIFDLYISRKYSITSLVEELSERGYKFTWDRIRFILSDKSYIGECEDRNKIFKNYPQIIDKEIFEEVQKIKEENYSTKSKESVNQKLALKILKCWKCGASYGYNSSNQYECNHHKYYKRFNTDRCDSIGINAEICDYILTEAFKTEYSNYLINLNSTTKKEILEKLEVLNQKLSVAKDNLENLKAAKEKAANLYIDNDISESQFKKKKEEISSKEDNIRTNISDYKAQIKSLTSTLEDLDSEEDWEKESRELSILVDTDTMKGISNLYELVHTHLKSAYVKEINHKGRDLKLVLVIGTSGEYYNFVYDFRDRSNKTRVISLTRIIGGYYNSKYYSFGNTCDYLVNNLDMNIIKKEVSDFNELIKRQMCK